MDNQKSPIVLPQKNTKSLFSDMRTAHVGIRTTDYDGLINWYVEKLDFRLVHKFNAGELLLAFLAPANDDRFFIEIYGSNEPDNTVPQPATSGFQHLCIEVDNVDNTLAELRIRGVNLLREPFNIAAIAKRCGFVADLHGNVIEFMENLA
jgi:lactoylglutathione lyase